MISLLSHLHLLGVNKCHYTYLQLDFGCVARGVMSFRKWSFFFPTAQALLPQLKNSERSPKVGTPNFMEIAVLSPGGM